MTTATSTSSSSLCAPIMLYHRPLLGNGKRLAAQCSRRSLASNPPRRAEEVRIVEVGPRDGLQNEKTAIGLETKLELIRRLSQTGVRNIEAGSFVAPKWVPQMANSTEILGELYRNPPPVPAPIAYNFLVPNLKGMQNFLKAVEASNAFKVADDTATITSPKNPNAPPTPSPSPSPEKVETREQGPITSANDPSEIPSSTSSISDPIQPGKSSAAPNWMEVSLFTAATEAFSKANTNCSIAESLERCKPIVSLANSLQIRVRGYVSVALGCPYEGPDVSPQKVAETTRKLLEMGANQVSVADTTGMGTMPKTQELLKALFAAGIEPYDLGFHFHDTYGQALCNTVVCLENDIRTFDSSVGGLGGCPYSKGATGNVATEDLLHCLHSLGIHTGVDVGRMAEIGAWISKQLGRPNDSRAGKALLARNSE